MNRRKIARRIVGTVVATACIVGLAMTVSATTISFGPSTEVGYSSGTTYYSNSVHTSNLTSVGFIGLPAGIFPYNKYVKIRLHGSQSAYNFKSDPVNHYSLGALAFDAYDSGDFYIGASTNASVGATVGVTVY
ncbi:MAG: hypothetical protein K6A80_10490 [Saccharofermentans sp.]|nr:hypothetical protein [Saccharofermentans sp.]